MQTKKESETEKNNKKEPSKEKRIKEDNKKETITIEEKFKQTEEKLLRTLAELENQRRRFEKEVKEAIDFGGFNFAKETLALIDNLQRAKSSMKNDQSFKEKSDLDKFLKNLEVIEKDLISIFEKNNIKKIDCLKKKFDPNIHQAMLEVEDDSIEPGLIVQEIQPGYMFFERLLRPSFVAVSKKKTDKDKNQENKGK
tara:strand:- start:229 stop:819 length:591 start_codon:yes stop_codon:yes gene_type:complete